MFARRASGSWRRRRALCQGGAAAAPRIGPYQTAYYAGPRARGFRGCRRSSRIITIPGASRLRGIRGCRRGRARGGADAR